MRYRLIAIVVAIAIVAPATVVKAVDTIEDGRRYTAMFYDGQLDSMWGNMTTEMQTALGSLEAFGKVHAQLMGMFGDEVAVVDEKVVEQSGYHVYLRTARYATSKALARVQIAFDAQGRIGGLYMQPVQEAAPSQYLDYRTKAPLTLPFEGEWTVFWGGRTIDQNYHAVAPDQRFAYDILIMVDGTSHTGDGTHNEDYYCFGRSVLAPGDGVVVSVENDVEDNVPGELNPAQPLGNHVIIDHGNGEFSFLAHFRMGSVAAKKGDPVKAGDLIGLCGNSGNTTEPHIHYHLQNSGVFGQGEGLPAQFIDYIADGKLVERGEPVKGQLISPHRR